MEVGVFVWTVREPILECIMLAARRTYKKGFACARVRTTLIIIVRKAT